MDGPRRPGAIARGLAQTIRGRKDDNMEGQRQGEGCQERRRNFDRASLEPPSDITAVRMIKGDVLPRFGSEIALSPTGVCMLLAVDGCRTSEAGYAARRRRSFSRSANMSSRSI